MSAGAHIPSESQSPALGVLSPALGVATMDVSFHPEGTVPDILLWESNDKGEF